MQALHSAMVLGKLRPENNPEENGQSKHFHTVFRPHVLLISRKELKPLPRVVQGSTGWLPNSGQFRTTSPLQAEARYLSFHTLKGRRIATPTMIIIIPSTLTL